MAKKRKRKNKKQRIAKVHYQTPVSKIRPVKIKGPRYYLKNARDYPILGCWVYAQWETSGIAPVIIARKQSEDRVIFGVCMIDLWCLGIKDAYANADISLSTFQKNLPRMCSNEPQECSVEFAHELIYGAMDFAKGHGFSPHRDFKRQMVDKVLDPPDMHPRTHNIEFGKDGKPFYFHGPNDDEAMQMRVMRTLERTAGPGNFDYVIGSGPPDFFDFDDDCGGD